jgi:hypothetical protein
MSFVDLMANDVWSEADIVRRTEAMIRSEFSQDAETILNRKVSGMVLGVYTPTEAEMAEMARYQATVEAARVAGDEARADMALLLRVFPMEEAQRRLDRMALVAAWDRLQEPEVEPIIDPETGAVLNEEAVAQDAAERAAAHAVVDPHLIETEDGETILDPAAVEADEAERAAAEQVIAEADPEAKALFDQRNQTTS